MIKVKSFTSQIKVYETMSELNELDQQVNRFLSDKKATHLISVSDTTTTDDKGTSIGIIRVIAYQE